MYAAAPSLALAVLGQASADRAISPEDESRLVGELLTHWALRSSLDRSAICATPPQHRTGALYAGALAQTSLAIAAS
jgi:hypothetical protein